MPLVIPPSRNYPSPLTAIPSLMQDEPMEGRKQIPVEILWGRMVPSFLASGVIPALTINVQNNATLEFSQISTLKIDNSNCGSDIECIFPDTSETISVPAYSPLVVVPVFSNSKTFYVIGRNAVTGDATRIQILNYAVPPISVPTSGGQNVSLGGFGGAIPIAINNSTPLIASTVLSGTITDVVISVTFFNSAVAGSIRGTLLSGAGEILGGTSMILGAAQTFTGVLLTLSNIELPFSQGGGASPALSFSQPGTNVVPVGGLWNVSVLYRTS